MKILFVTDLYPIGDENISKALFYFAREWRKQGHEVEVIRPNFIFNTRLRGRKIKEEKIYFESGIKIYNLNFITPFWFDVRKKLPKNFSLNNYNIMISHMPSGALMALRLLEKENIKYVCSVHASDIKVLKDFKYAVYFRQKLKQAYLKAEKISARSPVLQRKIEQIIPEIQDKTFVAYSGINKNVDMIDLKRKFDYETLKICTASKLLKRKNIAVIIKSLTKLHCSFKLTVMGEGSEYKKLVKLAEKLKIRDKIDFKGALSRDDVIKNMRQNDIFVLLSRNETFGLVYLEAMESGNIVIAKKDDGIDGILKDGQNAFLINAEVEELAKCLEKILNIKETELEKIRLNAAETIKNMTEEKSAESYINNIFT